MDDFDIDDILGKEIEEPEEATPRAKRKPAETRDEMLLSYLLANPTLYVRAKPILKDEWFGSSYSPVARFVNEYFDEHHALPSALVVEGKTGVSLLQPKDAEKKDVMDFIAGEIEYFAQEKALNDLIEAALLRKDDSPRSKEEMAVLSQRMKEISHISMTNDLGSEVYRDYKEKLKKEQETSGIATGYKFIDELINGGVKRPSFNVISAGTGDGKSIMLANACVYHSLIHNKDVIYYTLENSEEVTHQRLVAIMTDLDINSLVRLSDQVDMKMYDLKSRGGGRIFVKRFPIRGTTMTKIEAHYHELIAREKADIGMVALDYLDVMSPTDGKIKRDDIATRDADIAQEVYEFAHANEQIVWSASQQTKGAEKEQGTFKSNVSGGTHKINAADFLVIAKRDEDESLISHIIFHIKKTRSSGALNARVPVYWDPHSQRQTTREEDRELFEECNPKIFGKKEISRVKNDPLVKEAVRMGAIEPAGNNPLTLISGRFSGIGFKGKQA